MEKVKRIRIYNAVIKKERLEKAKEYFKKMKDRKKARLLDINEMKEVNKTLTNLNKEGNKYYMIKFRCEMEEFNKIYTGLYRYIRGEA